MSACNAGDPGSIPGLGRAPGEGNGNPLQHSCLENPMDGGAWQAIIYGVTKSRTRLSDFTPSLLMVFIWVISQLQGEWRARERKWDFVFRIYGVEAWCFCSLVFTGWVFHFIELVTLLIRIRLLWNNKWALLSVIPGTVWALNTWGINNQNRENHVFS